MTTQEILKLAKQASREMAGVSGERRNDALLAMADALCGNIEPILEANRADLQRAQGSISEVMMDRLRLDEARVRAMADGIRDVARLDDPTGRLIDQYVREDELTIRKVSVPLGVIAIIYESRPNVTSDAAALAIKSGNVCILRSGKEAHASARAVADAMREGLEKVGLCKDAVLLVDDTTRASATELMTANGYVDLLIPRGGKGLIRACVENATVPCIETGTGICHIYVDGAADFDRALNIIENAKTSRPSVCNAAEVCLIDRKILPQFLPLLEERLTNRQPAVELRMSESCLPYSACGVAAGDEDFDTEFHDYILAVEAVDGVDGAISHIAAHSTGHSEAIITDNTDAADRFCRLVDSAAVYVNASTRFTDGGEFGLGCEMGISTQKLHARGPMGLKELTTYKYVILGEGHVR